MGTAQAGVPGDRLNPQTVRMANMTADMDLTNEHLSGNRILAINSGVATTLTIPDTLVGIEPLTVINEGAGLPTIAAGGTTTLKAPGNFLTLTQQYSSCVIIPDVNNSNTYWVLGDLS